MANQLKLPSALDINPIPDDADGTIAEQHFVGKTPAEATALFQDAFEVYHRDLLFMGSQAFCFYLPAAIAYAESGNAINDPHVADAMLQLLTIRWQSDRDEIGGIRDTMVEYLERVLHRFPCMELASMNDRKLERKMRSFVTKLREVSISHPLFDRFVQLNNEAAERLPTTFDAGFGSLGLILSAELENGGYWCTPANTRSFAHTGGEGVHFSFVVERDRIHENSPVIVTIPGPSFDRCNFVVGENLYDFLCLGMSRGYFALEQLGHDLELTLDVYSDPNWQPTSEAHYCVGYGVDMHNRALLEFLAARMGLQRWTNTREKFARLQDKYSSVLDIPPLDDIYD